MGGVRWGWGGGRKDGGLLEDGPGTRCKLFKGLASDDAEHFTVASESLRASVRLQV